MWSELTAAVKMFKPESTMLDFFNKTLKWQADICRESTKFAMFKTESTEAANLQVFLGMVKYDAELELLYSMVK